jgi:hypothetical protein
LLLEVSCAAVLVLVCFVKVFDATLMSSTVMVRALDAGAVFLVCLHAIVSVSSW